MRAESDKVMTQHPEKEKTGVNIDRSKYEFVKQAVLKVIKEQQPITPKDLFMEMSEKYGADFQGSITWYTESIKLDLEARGVIAHDRKTRKITLV